MARILVVDDEEGMRSFLGEALESDGHAVTAASDTAAALAILSRQAHDVVITDLRMPGGDGMEVVRHLHAQAPETEVIVLTAHGTVDSAVAAMKLGAFESRSPARPSCVCWWPGRSSTAPCAPAPIGNGATPGATRC
jgi:two-component system response regulator FlrC